MQAGARLADVNRQLAREGQWLPVETAFDDATIGGIVATNDAGPLRHRYGTPRDLLIGITLAMTDGRLVKAGGHVVKNVAGYDLGKLVSGSFGTLAAIVDATFKLLPIPPASRTVAASYLDGASLAGDVALLSASQLEPVALDMHVQLRPSGGAARAAASPVRPVSTSPGATASQASAAQGMMKGRKELLSDAAEASLWAEQVRRPWAGAAAVVRLSWLPASLPHVLALFDEVHGVTRGAVELTARAAAGAGLLAIDADDPAVAHAIDLLRSRPGVVSNVVVLRQSLALKHSVDVWGRPPDVAEVLRSLKQTFDPSGHCSTPGRGPI